MDTAAAGKVDPGNQSLEMRRGWACTQQENKINNTRMKGISKWWVGRKQTYSWPFAL